MRYDPTKHHRRSIRLPGYDYGQAAAYFVTICTQNRECIFDDVIEGQMVLNDPGKVVESVWRELPEHYPGVAVDACAVMPNHLHGIIILVGAGPSACPHPPGQPQGVAPTLSLTDVVQRFKSLTTAKCRKGVRDSGWQPFAGRLWQRNYWERVIRDERELDRVRQYIAENPLRWESDPENVGTHGHAPLHDTPYPNGGCSW